MKTLSLVLLLGLGTSLRAADWPQWLGPNRDGHSPEKGLLKEWPRGGPKLVWTFKNTGAGYSSPAIVGDKLYILGTRDSSSFLFCLDVGNGTELWKSKLGPVFDFKGNQWGAGPRGTPTIADGLVYALNGDGELVCVKADDGKEVWRTDMIKNLGGQVNPIQFGEVDKERIAWGYSWSPLVDGDHLICFPGGAGGALAALDRKKGNVVWRSKKLKAMASYSSPIVAEIDSVRQYIVLHNEGLAGVSVKDGDLLWSWAKKPSYGDVVIPTPLYADGHVYISAGYKPATCDLIKVTSAGGKFTADKVYKTAAQARVMKNLCNGSVLVKGHVYGSSERNGWVCQELKSGKKVWDNKDGLGDGSLIHADGHLYLYGEEDGKVVMIEASSAEWKEKGRFVIPQQGTNQSNGKKWTPPVIANGSLFLRDQEYLFCYQIK